jgi:hypothetical protein
MKTSARPISRKSLPLPAGIVRKGVTARVIRCAAGADGERRTAGAHGHALERQSTSRPPPAGRKHRLMTEAVRLDLFPATAQRHRQAAVRPTGQQEDRKAPEKAQLDDAGCARIQRFETREGIFECDEIHIVRRWGRFGLFQGDDVEAMSALRGTTVACRVHQDSPHHPRHCRKKMRPVLPAHCAPVEKPQVRLLVRLFRLPPTIARLVGQQAPRHVTQLAVHDRGQSFERLGRRLHSMP